MIKAIIWSRLKTASNGCVACLLWLTDASWECWVRCHLSNLFFPANLGLSVIKLLHWISIIYESFFFKPMPEQAEWHVSLSVCWVFYFIWGGIWVAKGFRDIKSHSLANTLKWCLSGILLFETYEIIFTLQLKETFHKYIKPVNCSNVCFPLFCFPNLATGNLK